MSAVRVIPLQAGDCLNLAALTERGAPWRLQAYPAGFSLLLHPVHGPVLFDTGYGESVVRAMRRWPGVLYGLVTPVRLHPQATARAQLAVMGFAPQDVRHIIVSHLHADHVGAARLSARHVSSGPRRLRNAAGAARPEGRAPGLSARGPARRFRGPCPLVAVPGGAPDLAPFAQVADVFGDSSVWAVPLPGHAPGMVGLLVPEAQGLSVLAADAAWSVRAAREARPPHPLARAAFSTRRRRPPAAPSCARSCRPVPTPGSM
ncbi:MBL fold metallo-hydrolase [Deinococcus multiflagellatus]|uniref:MBL fold metallo-hydrolase n=1 Tax=Deinococcus multiflagellatus TaxID=1656887 RepID=A0ABW1ZJI2_9DEIO